MLMCHCSVDYIFALLKYFNAKFTYFECTICCIQFQLLHGIVSYLTTKTLAFPRGIQYLDVHCIFSIVQGYVIVLLYLVVPC